MVISNNCAKTQMEQYKNSFLIYVLVYLLILLLYYVGLSFNCPSPVLLKLSKIEKRALLKMCKALRGKESETEY